MPSKEEEAREVAAAATKVAVEVAGPPNRVVLRIIFIILLVLALLWVLAKLTGIILLLVLSIFFAYLVSPLVEFLRRPFRLGKRDWIMPRPLAISVAYLIILAAIFVAIYVVLPSLGSQFPEFAEQAKGYWKTLGEKTHQFNEYIRGHRIPDPIVNAVDNAVPRLVENVSGTVSALVSAALAYVIYIPWLILIPILAFFLLKDAESFRRSALQMLPRGRWRWRGDEFFQDVNSTLAAYVRAQLTACLFVGVVCALGFTLLGLPGPLVMGFLAGVFEFVPLIGPLTVALVAALLALLHTGPFNAFFVLVFLGVLRIAQDYVIYPRLIGQGIHLHPLAVIFAILAGAEVAGVAGIFLAIPVVAILTVSYRHWMEHRGSEGIADLLEPAPGSSETVVHVTAKDQKHPLKNTTPEDMARVRPDLTTGELKLPIEE
ncbi:MAG TPA: AI-2E family transporter [Pyrinomonadaceae bacterium]|nr:AI-2E family transporter [Pyrinomonadaceae bacterium]